MHLNTKKWKKKIMKITMKKVEKNENIIYNMEDLKKQGKKL